MDEATASSLARGASKLARTGERLRRRPPRSSAQAGCEDPATICRCTLDRIAFLEREFADAAEQVHSERGVTPLCHHDRSVGG